MKADTSIKALVTTSSPHRSLMNKVVLLIVFIPFILNRIFEVRTAINPSISLGTQSLVQFLNNIKSTGFYGYLLNVLIKALI